MLKPLSQWCCDSCGGIIDGPMEGHVEWYTTHRTRKTSGCRIVHMSRECASDAAEQAALGRTATVISLDRVVGRRGMACLLKRIGEVVGLGWAETADGQAFVELMRRVQLPYYEEARLFWDVALAASIHDGTSYDEATLLRILRWKESEVWAGLQALRSQEVTASA